MKIAGTQNHFIRHYLTFAAICKFTILPLLRYLFHAVSSLLPKQLPDLKVPMNSAPSAQPSPAQHTLSEKAE